LSLIEVGPAEVEPAAAAPVDAPRPPAAPVKLDGRAAVAHEVRSTEPEDDDGAESSEDDEDAADADD